MRNSALLKMITNAFLSNRYTLENLQGFTKVGTISKEQFEEITGFNYEDSISESISVEVK
ncbi:XkdX family protein [Brochothrix thermosphacta]|uniref:XkdX family protein n=1 Tax=Brochothrix thermosphacta TaxID=2756 RepID=UPI0027134080|nr:XkdX family protein [Brochothrix thermosphacta]MDO7864909.1 XkdX family protein [Brochothrix thermosphacta]